MIRPPGPQTLGYAFLLSEAVLSVSRRSRGTGVKQDKSTLRILWLTIAVSVAASVYVARHATIGNLSHPTAFRWMAVALFVLGILIRWWAIIVLGRFFTVDVQIEADHELVDRGPFHLVRHPSYTGVLLAFVGFGLSLMNWIALVVLIVPIFAAFVYRMNVEEEALSGALGDRYRKYMMRTKRLIPGIY